MMKRARATTLAVFVGSALVGCAGNGPPPTDTASPGGTGVDFATIQTDIFDAKCLSAGCHNATDRGGVSDLVLDATSSYSQLVNVPSTNAAAHAAGLLRVAAGQPDQSFLVIKLTAPVSGEGALMPLAAAALSPADIDLIRAWILAGALQSSLPTATASATPTASDSPTPPPTATATLSPTVTATPTQTPLPSATPTGTLHPTATATQTLPPTFTPTVTPTASATATPSSTPTATTIPTPTFSVDATLPQIQATIFTMTCLGISCHNATDAGGGLVLDSAHAFADLVGVVPQNAAAQAAGMLRVDPGKPENSFLITKLTLPTAFDVLFQSRMPLGGTPLTATQIEQIRAWILRGALLDEAAP